MVLTTGKSVVARRGTLSVFVVETTLETSTCLSGSCALVLLLPLSAVVTIMLLFEISMELLVDPAGDDSLGVLVSDV